METKVEFNIDAAEPAKQMTGSRLGAMRGYATGKVVLWCEPTNLKRFLNESPRPPEGIPSDISDSDTSFEPLVEIWVSQETSFDHALELLKSAFQRYSKGNL